MVSNTTRIDVWQGLLEMVRHHRYYVVLEARYRRKHYWVRFLLALSALVTVVPLLPKVPMYFSSIGGVLVISLVVWDLLFDYGKKVSALNVFVAGLHELENLHRGLWAKTYSNTVSDEEAREQMDRLSNEASNLVRRIDIIDDERLIVQCWEETVKMETARYVTG